MAHMIPHNILYYKAGTGIVPDLIGSGLQKNCK